MKSKFKDLLLYCLATIGVVALFISATQTQASHSTVPESHVWELFVLPKDSGQTGGMAINKATGEVRKYSSWNVTIDKNLKIANREVNKYVVMIEAK